MRILYLEASAGRVVGGSLTGMLHLVRGLDRSRYEPSVVLYEHKPIIEELDAEGIDVHVFDKRRLPKEHGLQESAGYRRAKEKPALARAAWQLRAGATLLFETVPAAVRLASIYRRARPDLVHVCNGFRANMDGILAAALTRVPCIVHSKGFDKFTFVERILGPRVAGAVSMTQAIEDHCRAAGVLPDISRVIFDGLDLASFRPSRDPVELRRELGVPADAPLVGVVGNVQEWKGQRVLVEAVDLLRERQPTLHALIVGGVHRSGLAYAESLRKLVATLGLEARVLFTGARHDVPDLMRAMDVVVHSSVRAEPFGRVIIEGMSVGRPVVATRAGGVPEFVRDGVDGLLVDPGDPSALAEVLDRLFRDAPLRQRLSEAAAQAVRRFSIERHVAQMTDLYDTVAGRARDRGAREPRAATGGP